MPPSTLMDCFASLAMTVRLTTKIAYDATIGKRHDRILLRLFQPLDLSRLSQHPAAGKGIRRRDFVAADPGRRHLQYHQPERLCLAGKAGTGQGSLPEERHAGLRPLFRTCAQNA